MFINNYVYYSGSILINDVIYSNLNKEYIFYCIDYNDDSMYNNIYLLETIIAPNTLFWALEKELTLVPLVKQRVLEVLCGKKFKT